jgi:hypothetical protein
MPKTRPVMQICRKNLFSGVLEKRDSENLFLQKPWRTGFKMQIPITGSTFRDAFGLQYGALSGGLIFSVLADIESPHAHPIPAPLKNPSQVAVRRNVCLDSLGVRGWDKAARSLCVLLITWGMISAAAVAR